MKCCCKQSVAFIVLLAFASIVGAQTQSIVTIDPAGEHSRVYLSLMDETTRAIVAGKFDFNAPRNQKYKRLASALARSSPVLLSKNNPPAAF